MPFIHSYYYYITIALQAICVIHCMRKGNQNRWIWVIVFLPVVGALAYVFTEMTPGRGIQQVHSGIGMVFNPGGRIKRLEENLRFTDTFSNRVELADAYLAAGQTDKAIELYESSLTGTFIENEHVLIRLTTAYFEKERYKDVIAVVRKIYKLPQFARSRSHMLYAIALEQMGQFEMAEKEIRMMKARFSHFESRYHYAKFLQRADRLKEARTLLNEMIDESRHLSPQERRDNRIWVGKAFRVSADRGGAGTGYRMVEPGTNVHRTTNDSRIDLIIQVFFSGNVFHRKFRIASLPPYPRRLY